MHDYSDVDDSQFLCDDNTDCTDLILPSHIDTNTMNVNGNVSFSDQVAMCELKTLRSESMGDNYTKVSDSYVVKNPYFDPVQARSSAIDQFQLLVEKELVNLKQRRPFVHYSGQCNLNIKQIHCT